MAEKVTQQRVGAVSVITMDDGKANAVDDATIDQLTAALDASADARAIVLAGRPGVLSGGFDLGVVGNGGPAAQALIDRGGALVLRLYTSPAPVVVACTGHAVALGAVFLLAGAWRVGAAGDARVGLNEVAIGLPLPPLLIRLARDRLAAPRRTEAVLLARMWTPDEAVAVGFLDEVVAGEEVRTTAVSRAAELAGRLQPDAYQASAALLHVTE